jgi:hypothetical protein
LNIETTNEAGFIPAFLWVTFQLRPLFALKLRTSITRDRGRIFGAITRASGEESPTFAPLGVSG